MEIEINKNRSFTACLRDARNFLIDHIETFAKKIWIPALILSAMIALCGILRLPNLALHNWGILHPWTSWIVQTIIYLGTLVVEIFYYSAVFNAANGYGWKKNLWRYLQLFLVSICVDIVLIAVCWGIKSLLTLIGGHALSHIANTTIFSLYILVCAALFLIIIVPMSYVAPKYMMDHDAKWKNFFKNFTVGFHRWSMLFLTGLLLALIMGLIMLVLSIPAIVLIFAQVSSQMGQFMGDPANLPGYFPYLTFIVFTLTTLLFTGIMVYAIMTFIYVYGSIETREKNKKEMTTKYDEKN
ncbi:MAG: hypothetical protein WCS17_11575 [Prevotella sp.]